MHPQAKMEKNGVVPSRAPEKNQESLAKIGEADPLIIVKRIVRGIEKEENSKNGVNEVNEPKKRHDIQEGRQREQKGLENPKDTIEVLGLHEFEQP